MNKSINYSRELENLIHIQQRQGRVPTLLLQCCCAPCSSYCLEYLREYFHITVYYYNPNITENAEYEKRKAEELRLIAEYNRQVDEKDFEGMHSTKAAHHIGIMECPYDPQNWIQAVRGLEDCREGGRRCEVCFRMRLMQTAKAAAEHGFDYFSTTLTISPLKNAQLLNEIGEEAAREYGVSFLPSDFKKKNGFLRSTQLSRRFSLYRQNYCGCVFSRRDAEEQAAGQCRPEEQSQSGR